MGIHNTVQRRIDAIGFVDTEISSPAAPVTHAPISGKDEYEWYNNQIYTGGDRRLRMQEYEDMNQYAEISSALDIYADDATQRNEDGYVLQIKSSDTDIRNELEDLFYRRIGIDNVIWGLARSLCMYGDYFSELVLSESKDAVLFLKPLPPKTMWRIETNGYLHGFVQQVPNGAPIHIDPFNLVHWRLPSTIHAFNPYGTSILESSRRVWRQLKLMEDAMVVYRVTRAPERRVFNIDVGNLPPHQAEAFVEKQRLRLRKRAIMNSNGELDYRANVMAPDEDFYIAKRNGQEGTTIETLDGAANLGETDDVVYFKDKIFAALKIPRIYLQDREGQSDRKQNVSYQDIMFARTIERIQNQIVIGLEKIAVVHLMLRGYKTHQLDDFQISMTPPSDLKERMMVDVNTAKIELSDKLITFGFSKEHAVQKWFNIDKENWEQIRTRRFEEKLEEAKVDSGELPGAPADKGNPTATPGNDADVNNMSIGIENDTFETDANPMAGLEAPMPKGLTFERINPSKHNSLLVQGELGLLNSKKKKSLLEEGYKKVLTEQAEYDNGGTESDNDQ